MSTASSSDFICWDAQEQNLQIDWSGALGYPCKLSITAWDKGLHWLSRIYDEIHRNQSCTKSMALICWRPPIIPLLMSGRIPFRKIFVIGSFDSSIGEYRCCNWSEIGAKQKNFLFPTPYYSGLFGIMLKNMTGAQRSSDNP